MLGSWHSGLPKPPFKEGPAAPLIGAVAGAAASSYIGATAIGLATTVGGFSIAGALAGALVSGVVSGALADDPKQPDFGANSAASGMLVNKAANDAPIPVVYGRRTVGGTRVLMEVTGAKNEYLHIVLVLSEGKISSIENIYLNDVISTDSRFSGFLDTYSHTGADNQTADAGLVNDVSGWTTDHRLRGTAYLYSKLKYDSDVYQSGLPTITADIKGVKVYDPRTSTTAWSDNPALCIRDYLTNTRYGRGIDASLIDDTAFNAAANYCEEQVTIGGETKDRYTLNGVVDTSQGSMDVLKKLLTACRGFLVFSGGKYKLIIDKPETAAFTFSEDNIVGAWSISLGDKNNQFNRIRANFFNPDRQWQPDIAVVDSPTLRTDDNGLLLEKTIDLPFTSDIDRAKMITTINLNQSRQQITCEFTATIEGLRCEVGDVVYIKHTTPGWDTLNSNQGKLFRIMRLTLQNNDEVRVLALEYDATAYDFGTIAVSDAAPNTNLPDPYNVNPPTGLTATLSTATAQSVDLSWTNSDGYTTKFSVYVKYDGDISYTHYSDTVDDALTVRDLPIGTYDFRVTATNSFGVESSPVTETDVEVPRTSAPTGLTSTLSTAIAQSVDLSWTDTDGFTAKFSVYVKYDGDSTYTHYFDTVDDALTVRDLPIGTYDFRVTATNSLGVESDHAEITGLVIPLPSPVTNLQTGFGAYFTTATLNVSWDAPADAVGPMQYLVSATYVDAAEAADSVVFSEAGLELSITKRVGGYYTIAITGCSSSLLEMITRGYRYIYIDGLPFSTVKEPQFLLGYNLGGLVADDTLYVNSRPGHRFISNQFTYSGQNLTLVFSKSTHKDNNVQTGYDESFITSDTSCSLTGVHTGLLDISIVTINSLGTRSVSADLTGFIPPPPMPSKVSGLELDLGQDGQANGTEWSGRDCKIKWRPASYYMTQEIDEAQEGADTGSLDWYHKDYEVEVYNGSTLLRTEYVTDTWYIYSYEKNFEDAAKNSTTPYRELTFHVRARGKQNQVSATPAIL